jgi:L-seryl-tRNA(Ser) seleniumtransferase
VHSSNFRLVGFTAEVGLPELVALGAVHALPVVDDLGSGTLLDTSQFGLAYEPRVQDSVQAGATLVTFSGDKLLGGPQAGLIVGKQDAVARLRSHPLTRALRVDKTTLAGLAATLGHYLRGEAVEAIPIWRMMAASPEELAERSKRWAAQLNSQGLHASIKPGASTVGGGSLPEETLPTHLLTLPGLPADPLAAALRRGQPAVVARIVEDAVCLDPRTVLPDQDEALLKAIVAAVKTLVLEM